jgi:hypothetical protein
MTVLGLPARTGQTEHLTPEVVAQLNKSAGAVMPLQKLTLAERTHILSDTLTVDEDHHGQRVLQEQLRLWGDFLISKLLMF